MTGTGLQLVERTLSKRWESAYDGPAGTRRYSVPEPTIVIAGDEDHSRLDARQDDLVFVRPGRLAHSPQSAGWRERKGEATLTIDCRTTEGRGRLAGHRLDSWEMEAYGGLKGEVQRILDEVRKGHAEFDWVDGYEWRDLTEEVGFSNWRGVWEVRATAIAENINP